jgi:hypothetical protein
MRWLKPTRRVEIRRHPERRDTTRSSRPGNTAGTLPGALRGFKISQNLLEVKSAKGSAKLELTHCPIAGPVFSGPHQKPFACQTEAARLGAALDDDCTVIAVVTYAYKSTTPPEGGGRGSGGQAPGTIISSRPLPQTFHEAVNRGAISVARYSLKQDHTLFIPSAAGFEGSVQPVD